MNPDPKKNEGNANSEPTPASITSTDNDSIPGRWQIRLLGIAFVLLALILAYLLLVLWPSDASGKKGGDVTQIIFFLFGFDVTFSMLLDTRLLLLVMVAGAMGSFVHIATSFSDFTGNQQLRSSWFWWYGLRPFIGMALAVIFYVAIRGGFLSAGSQPDINPFGVTALAALVGMFSKQATDKLNEVFDTLFKSAAGDSKRKNSLEHPLPVVSDVEPRKLVTKTGNLEVTVIGDEFADTSVVVVNGTNRETKFVDKNHLTSVLLPGDVEQEGELQLSVVTPPPGGGRSAPIKVTISEPPAADPKEQEGKP